MGAFIRVKCNYVELAELKRNDVIPKIYGAVLNGKPIFTEKLEAGLIVIGNEANGIQSENLPLISNPITIPAAAQNGTESLNAAIATGIIVSEFYRQLNFKNQL
jgi:TrmH family RNA methyltransferase